MKNNYFFEISRIECLRKALYCQVNGFFDLKALWLADYWVFYEKTH